MPSMRNLALAASLGMAPGGNFTTEYLAFAPQGPRGTPFTRLEWVEVTYPDGVSDANDVTIAPLDASPPEVGAWRDLDFAYGVTVTGKIVEDRMYAFLAVGTEGENDSGCCADTLRVYSRSSDDASQQYRDVDLTAIVDEALPHANAAATHTFDIEEIDGVLYGFALVRYAEPDLGDKWADAIVKFSTEDGAVIPTADGRKAFVVLAEAGRIVSPVAEQNPVVEQNPFVIDYFDDPSIPHQWHANGVERFVANSGVAVLAMTFLLKSEAVLFKDPFTYPSSDGGGRILQRFGTPVIGVPNGPPPGAKPYDWPPKRGELQPKRRYFGVKTTDLLGSFYGGVHNMYHRASSEALGGRESISIFVNRISSTERSYAVEFAVRLTEEESQGGERYDDDDDVFATDYVVAELSFAAPLQGGARAIGDGVFLTMSGSDLTGLEVADMRGNSHSYAPFFVREFTSGEVEADPQSLYLYDPFIFVRKGQKWGGSKSFEAVA